MERFSLEWTNRAKIDPEDILFLVEEMGSYMKKDTKRVGSRRLGYFLSFSRITQMSHIASWRECNA
jgi:hypothetical protein